MGESRLPRDPPSNPDTFLIHEGATGKTFPIREASDEQLARHAADAITQHQQFVRESFRLIGEATNAAKAHAVIAYEIDRRKRTITLAGAGDLANLTNLSSFRRQ
jgi:hypothetical protein